MIRIVATSLFFVAFSALADGSTASTGKATVGVVDSVKISSGFSPAILKVNPNTGGFEMAETSFVVKANSINTAYDVWVTVPPENLDSNNRLCLAVSSDGSEKIPISLTLMGNSGENRVDTEPAEIQLTNGGRPATGRKLDGDGVMGTDRYIGTTYRVQFRRYGSANEPRAGIYSLSLTAHVAQND